MSRCGLAHTVLPHQSVCHLHASLPLCVCACVCVCVCACACVCAIGKRIKGYFMHLIRGHVMGKNSGHIIPTYFTLSLSLSPSLPLSLSPSLPPSLPLPPSPSLLTIYGSLPCQHHKDQLQCSEGLTELREEGLHLHVCKAACHMTVT